MYKKSLKLDRPVYVGMSILELSKELMYDVYYNKLKKQYASNITMLYTDTYSLLLEIKTEDVYKDMASQSYYDTSNYPKDHELYSTKNKMIPGLMKDECGGYPIIEYVGLRPKMYSIHHEKMIVKNKPREYIRKAKGIKKTTVQQELHHKEYLTALFEKKVYRNNMNVLRSRGHQLYGENINKVSLCGYDSKRYILPDGIETLAYGHKDLKIFS